MYNRQLDTFLCVAKEGSFSGAAARLYISPSAVHQQINHLEAYLEVKLLDRSPQGVKLTPAGELLWLEGQRIVKANEVLIRQLQKVNQEDNSTIRVGTTLLAKCRLLIELWNEFSIVRPGYHLLLEDIGMKMENRKGIDLIEGIRLPILDDDYSYLCLGTVPLACAVPDGHHLYRHQELSWEDLIGETLVTIHPAGLTELKTFVAEAEQHCVKLRIVDKYDHAVFSRCLLEKSVLQIPLCWKDILPAEMKTLLCNWNCHLSYGFYYSKEPDSAVLAFIHFLEQKPHYFAFPWIEQKL